MFDLISGGPRHPFHDRTLVPTVASVVGHVVIIFSVVVLPLMYFSGNLPEVPTMMAFAVAAPPPPPPPPPPPAARATQPKPVAPPTTGTFAAPIEAPVDIRPEPASLGATSGGVEGGVEGGIEGGVLGGIVGGLVAAAPPPPPPPPPPPTPPKHVEPIHVGGQITAPALVYRVEPVYPPVAVAAKVSGVVILEAVVDEEGCVKSVNVLRPVPLLTNAAIDAVRQWRYSPLVLNGIATPFVLTVTLSFHVG